MSPTVTDESPIDEFEDRKDQLAGDWVIPNDSQGLLDPCTLGLDDDDDEDFVIGKDLVKATHLAKEQDLERQAIAGLTTDSLAHLLFQDFAEDPALPPTPEKEFSAMDLMDQYLADWKDLSREQAMALGAAIDWVPPESSLVLKAQKHSLQEVYQLNQRISRDCQEILANFPDVGTTPQAEFETLRRRIILDRDLIDEQTEKVQDWINRCILQGELDNMHHYNRIKNALFETQGLIKRLCQQYFINDTNLSEPVQESSALTLDPSELILEAKEESTVECPDLTHNPYAIPDLFPKAPAVKPSKPVSKGRIKRDLSLFKAMAAILIFIVIPIGYKVISSYTPEKRQRETMDIEIYRVAMNLTEAFVAQGNFVGKVGENWARLDVDRKRKQMENLVHILEDQKYNSVVIYFPDGRSAAHYIMGKIVIY